MEPRSTRRQFLLWCGRAVGVTALGGVAVRVLRGGSADSEFIQPPHRYGWQINPELCTYCGLCETACTRTPSAIKAVNDQKKCSNCVACYGHIRDLKTASEDIQTSAAVVCPTGAVIRTSLFDGLNGTYRYEIDPDKCTGCSKCARQCNLHGSKSMFLIIRPDVCFGCNDCSVARVCPSKAVERVPLYPADDFRGDYMPEDQNA